MHTILKFILVIFGIFTIVLATAWLARVPLLIAHAEFFTVHNADKGADAMIVLSGGMSIRLPRALELYAEGYAPLLLLTEERIRHTNKALRSYITRSNRQFTSAKEIISRMNAGRDETNQIKDVPIELIPSLTHGATSTFDEAHDALVFSKARGYTRLIIVSDDSHTRRALLAFEKVFAGSGIVVQAMGAPNALYNETNWWHTDVGLSTYIQEPIKYAVYLFTSGNVSFVRNH